jgi:hypothetical protein
MLRRILGTGSASPTRRSTSPSCRRESGPAVVNRRHRFASMPLWLPRVHDFWSRFAVELGISPLAGQHMLPEFVAAAPCSVPFDVEAVALI